MLTLASQPQVNKTAILGIAAASSPRDQPDNVIAFVELDFSATADMTNGYLFVQDSIALTSSLPPSTAPVCGNSLTAGSALTPPVRVQVKFGDQQTPQTAVLSLNDFVDVCLKRDSTDNQNELESDYVLSLDAGGIILSTVVTKGQMSDTAWTVQASTVAFGVSSRIRPSWVSLAGAAASPGRIETPMTPILSRRMQLIHTSTIYAASDALS
ncbi:hypothetical protein EDB81DRAFT_755222 [Dactylonectria macrodidyma]|uniref:Uncharacterized protein n=1 Tax=Dactylonectria macrodidyma TaxID=307937 RepID=A0A9P9JG33_9HYPO|nr:hypothetical protein EDB81DRAFT_755222 [Dactylonectria macrodidyma]